MSTIDAHFIRSVLATRKLRAALPDDMDLDWLEAEVEEELRARDVIRRARRYAPIQAMLEQGAHALVITSEAQDQKAITHANAVIVSASLAIEAALRRVAGETQNKPSARDLELAKILLDDDISTLANELLSEEA